MLSTKLSRSFLFIIINRGLKRSFSCAKMNAYTDTMRKQVVNIVPPLTSDKHKGQAGRIGIIGGSLEYTGAPYFAAISALKTGSDLAYIFCTATAAAPIKSYSPELIVLPYLDSPNAIEDCHPWLERLDAVLIGPGLGRSASILKTVTTLIELCRTAQKPLVIDADGLFLIAQAPQLVRNWPVNLVMTPNIMEFARLGGEAAVVNFGTNVTILVKGATDVVYTGGKKVALPIQEGSNRRCGGQGDLLSGSLATFFAWSNKTTCSNDILACFAACLMTRLCNGEAFRKHGRSMTCTDMIKEIGPVFNRHFERQ